MHLYLAYFSFDLSSLLSDMDTFWIKHGRNYMNRKEYKNATSISNLYNFVYLLYVNK